MSHILVQKQGRIKLICWSDGRSLLDSNESTHEENALSELVELALTQIIHLATNETRGSDSSISFYQFSGFAFLFIGSHVIMWCNRPRMAWMAGSPHLRRQVHVIFLDEHIQRPVLSLLWVTSLADSLLYSVSLPLDSMMMMIACAPERCFINLLVVPTLRQTSAFRQRRQTGCFWPWRNLKNDHMPERNAALFGLAPSATAIDSTARF